MPSYKEYLQFYIDFHSGDFFQHMRFGQAFISELDIQDQELFYSEDEKYCQEIILEKYIDWSK